MGRLCFCLILSLGITCGMAQGKEDSTIPRNRVGIRGGLNFSKIDSDLGANTIRRRDFHMGAFYQKFLSRRLAIQPELQYSDEGWIRELPTGDVPANLHYGHALLVAKYYPFDGFNLQGGISLSLLIDATEENLDLLALDRRLDRFNTGIVFGAGFDTPFGVSLGARYVNGIIDINEGYNASTVDDKIRTNNFQVYIGYALRLSRKTGTGEDD